MFTHVNLESYTSKEKNSLVLNIYFPVMVFTFFGITVKDSLLCIVNI